MASMDRRLLPGAVALGGKALAAPNARASENDGHASSYDVWPMSNQPDQTTSPRRLAQGIISPRLVLLILLLVALGFALLLEHPSHLQFLIVISVFIAALTSSVAGFAFSAVCGAILFHLISEPVEVVEIMVVCSIAMQATMVWQLRRVVDWQALRPFVAAGVFGLPVGVYWLLFTDHSLYTKIIGIVLIAYGAYMLFRRPIIIKKKQGWRGDAVAGFLGGVTGGLVAFPGAFVTIWCSTKGWDRDRQRGVYQPFILIMQVFALILVQLLHPHAWTGAKVAAAAAYLPAAVIGSSIGMACYRKLSESQFAAVVNFLILISGISLAA
jgi:uncharacterized protein